MKRLTLLALNELNFDMVRRYVERLPLRNFQRLLDGPGGKTCSEDRYDLLEPWIQWVSVHTGLDAHQHGVTRLGDIVGSGIPQVFEQLEAEGVSVGAVCAMNAENRLRRAEFFLPDPWTRTPSDGSFWSRHLSAAISQAVNDNAKARLTPSSLLVLLGGLLRFAQLRHVHHYVSLALRSCGAPWRRALFLDLFLHDLHQRWQRAKAPGFSLVFLNAGAHIQHHYLFNAKAFVTGKIENPAWYINPTNDPVAEMLCLYDRILGDYLRDGERSLIVATGLSQQPYDRVKYYHRLKDHAAFLTLLGIVYRRVEPRMTRDFLIDCGSAEAAATAEARLAEVVVTRDGQRLFREIDNRGNSLFVTLTYPDAIDAELEIAFAGGRLRLAPHVSFVAIKNGMHCADGYAYYRGEVGRYAPAPGSHVKSLYATIRGFFERGAAPAPRPTFASMLEELRRLFLHDLPVRSPNTACSFGFEPSLLLG